MSSALMEVDLPLDEIVKRHSKKNFNRNRRGNFRRFRGRGSGSGPQQRFLPDRWERDLHPRGPSQTASNGKVLLVSNLSFMVTDEDVHELFSELGPVKKCFVNYDKAGRSHGTAEVFFFRREDAQSAFQKYNNVPLDGRPMKLQFVTASSAAPQRNSQRFSIARGSGNRGNRSNQPIRRRFNPVSKAKWQNPARVGITKESLDADLEAYKKIAHGEE